jgi:homocitrate synthase
MAILSSPSTYEIINPADFGLPRYVHFASRLTGWNAIKSRAQQLNLHMTDAQYKECTTKIKALADIRPIAIDDADSIIRGYYNNIKTGAAHPLLGDLSAQEQAAVEAKELEIQGEPEKRQLEATAEAQAEVERT